MVSEFSINIQTLLTRCCNCDDDDSAVVVMVGVEQDLAILQEFLIPGVLWGYLECIHFPEITNSRTS